MRHLHERLVVIAIAGALTASGTATVSAAPVPAAILAQNVDSGTCDESQAQVPSVADFRAQVKAAQARDTNPQPETLPQCDLSQAITETVNIETPAKRPDGTPARVQLRLKRPKTLPGVKIPTIIEPSPYNGATQDTLGRHANSFAVDATPPLGQAIHQWIADTFPAAGAVDPNQEDLPVTNKLDPAVAAAVKWDMTYEPFSDNYFVPLGYAVADLDALGTGKSEGCVDPGSPSEQAGVKAAVDWLNGRATGYDENGDKLTADDWSNGRTALKGKSYDGALAVEGAASGVEGLKTIVDVAGISDWYGYTRSNGVVVNPDGSGGYDLDNLATYVSTGPDRHNCNDRIKADITANLDRNTGNRNAFWDTRNYTGKVTADQPSVFLIQGMQDSTVRPSQATEYWQALQKAGVPSKLWVTQGQHFRPYSQRPNEYPRQMHRWFDYWLGGIDNGIMNEPKVDVQQGNLTTWTTQDSWPAAGATAEKLTFAADGSLRKDPKLPFARQSMTDDGVRKPLDTIIDHSGGSNAQSLAYLTPALGEDVTLQGTPSFTVNATVDGPSPYLTALLVDYGPAESNTWRTKTSMSSYSTLNDCFGQVVDGNSPCAHPYAIYKQTNPADYTVITRGWADIRHWMGDRQQAIVLDRQPTTVTWKAEPANYTVPKGHRIGVVLMSTDEEQVAIYTGSGITYTPHYTGADNDPTTLTALTGFSSVTLPVTTGSEALKG
ncbi:CocE/NonD family hydrolase [Kitasatospora indigofera]|uniref:CocE/NonD family hydrolase n=1 Tax=Kitasatospora indigofera TaxID=67307 RepID=UPI0036C5790C